MGDGPFMIGKNVFSRPIQYERKEGQKFNSKPKLMSLQIVDRSRMCTATKTTITKKRNQTCALN